MISLFNRLTSHHYIGPILIVSSSLLFAISHSLSKFLTGILSVPEVMLLRFLLSPLILLPMILLGILHYKVHSWKKMWVRTFFGVFSMFFYFLALKYGDAGKATLIFQCSTIWVYVFERLFWGISPSIQTKLMVPIAMIGTLLVIQPAGLLAWHPADVLAIIASIFNAGVFLSLKSLRNDHSSISIVVANQTLSALVVIVFNLMTLPTLSTQVIAPTPSLLIAIAGLSITGFLGNIAMTAGFKFTSATVSANLLLLVVPLMYLAGILFFNETVNSLSIVGGILTLVSLVIISKYR